MTHDAFIEDAIATGARLGLSALEADQRMVFLIAEAECLCDMECIDSFLDKYSPSWLPEAALAFEAVGAIEIAAELRAVPLDIVNDDPRLDRLNALITARAGYDYGAIKRTVARRRVGG